MHHRAEDFRLETFDNEINNKLAEFSYRGRTISNYEMESSAIYGLSALTRTQSSDYLSGYR